MTNREKIIEMEDIIYKLYVNEGRSKVYISKLLDIDRKILTNYIKEQHWIQGDHIYVSPSNQKFINKNRTLIKSRLDNDITINEIADELNVNRYYLQRISEMDGVIQQAFQEYHNRIHNKARSRREKLKERSSREYNIEDLPGEKWELVWGHDYYVSNMGRVKKYIKSYDDYMLIKSFPNVNNNRPYVKIGDENYQLARLVAHCFVEGYSEDNNTVNHIDGNVLNNKADNLEWVSQSENNKKAYINGRTISVPYSKYGNFKKIILNNKYEFSSVESLARFLRISPTQVRRYIDGESDTYHTFQFKY